MITQESVDSDFCRKLLIPTVVILLLGFSPPSISQEFLLLTNANVVNPRSQQIAQGHLLIADNKIVKTMSEVPGDFQGATIDLGGKWVIPGLNELHTHSMGNMVPPFTLDAIGTTATARRLLSVGVTSLLDLFNDEDYIYRLRALQREWVIPGADIFASLSCLTATNGHCTEYGLPARVIDSPEQAKQVVTELARKQPDVIKIVYQQGNRMPTISLATLKEAVKTANSLGLKTVIHIWSISDMEGAIAAGPSSLTQSSG